MSVVIDKIDSQLSKYPKRQYPKDQIIVFAGEEPSHIFYITSGKVIQYDVSYRGDEVIVNVFKAPAFFPLSWAINGTHNSYFYKTEEDSEVHLVPPEKALEFLKSNPDVMFDLISRIYRGVDGLLSRQVQLMSGSAKTRILHEILIEARRFAAEQSDGTRKLKINESDLASRAGLSRETVNREMRKIKRVGMVRIEKNTIIVPDLAALEKTIGQTD